MTLHTCPGTDERGCPNLTTAVRCPECATTDQRRRGSRGERTGTTGRWRKVRKRALRRAGYRCERCDAPYPLEVHHVNGNPTDDRLENALVLCIPCHRKQHGGAPVIPGL